MSSFGGTTGGSPVTPSQGSVWHLMTPPLWHKMAICCSTWHWPAPPWGGRNGSLAHPPTPEQFSSGKKTKFIKAAGNGGRCYVRRLFWGLRPPVRRRVVCRSQMSSTSQHNKSLVSGTTGAFRRRSDKRLVELDLQRPQCQADTSFLLVTGTAGAMTRTLEPCNTHSGMISAATQAVRINQTTTHDIGPSPPTVEATLATRPSPAQAYTYAEASAPALVQAYHTHGQRHRHRHAETRPHRADASATLPSACPCPHQYTCAASSVFASSSAWVGRAVH